MALAKIDEIESKAGRKFEWIHWSDDDAIKVFRPASESMDYLEIQAYSHGRISLQGVEKPRFSVNARCRLLRRLLQQDRIFISDRCTEFTKMLEHAQTDQKGDFVGNMHKHPFDAGTYPIYMECRYELMDESSRKPNASKILIPRLSECKW